MEDQSALAQKNFQQIAENITENLVDELSVTSLLQQLFEGYKVNEIEKIMQIIRKILNQKSEQLKIKLSSNYNYLFGCSDLITQIKEFMAKSRINIEGLSSLEHQLSLQQEDTPSLNQDSQNLQNQSLKQHMFQVSLEDLLQSWLYWLQANLQEIKEINANNGKLDKVYNDADGRGKGVSELNQEGANNDCSSNQEGNKGFNGINLTGKEGLLMKSITLGLELHRFLESSADFLKFNELNELKEGQQEKENDRFQINDQNDGNLEASRVRDRVSQHIQQQLELSLQGIVKEVLDSICLILKDPECGFNGEFWAQILLVINSCQILRELFSEEIEDTLQIQMEELDYFEGKQNDEIDIFLALLLALKAKNLASLDIINAFILLDHIFKLQSQNLPQNKDHLQISKFTFEIHYNLQQNCLPPKSLSTKSNQFPIIFNSYWHKESFSSQFSSVSLNQDQIREVNQRQKNNNQYQYSANLMDISKVGALYESIFSDYETQLKSKSTEQSFRVLEKYKTHHSQLDQIFDSLDIKIDVKNQLEVSWNKKEESLIQSLDKTLEQAQKDFSSQIESLQSIDCLQFKRLLLKKSQEVKEEVDEYLQMIRKTQKVQSILDINFRLEKVFQRVSKFVNELLDQYQHDQQKLKIKDKIKAFFRTFLALNSVVLSQDFFGSFFNNQGSSAEYKKEEEEERILDQLTLVKTLKLKDFIQLNQQIKDYQIDQSSQEIFKLDRLLTKVNKSYKVISNKRQRLDAIVPFTLTQDDHEASISVQFLEPGSKVQEFDELADFDDMGEGLDEDLGDKGKSVRQKNLNLQLKTLLKGGKLSLF